jgi:hypothetical protein
MPPNDLFEREDFLLFSRKISWKRNVKISMRGMSDVSHF